MSPQRISLRADAALRPAHNPQTWLALARLAVGRDISPERQLLGCSIPRWGVAVFSLLAMLAIGCQPASIPGPDSASSGPDSTKTSPQLGASERSAEGALAGASSVNHYPVALRLLKETWADPTKRNWQGLGPQESGSQEPASQEASNESSPKAADQEVPSNNQFEALYPDWPKPEILLFISGRQHGYIEPCGCAGLDVMKGGLLRRHAAINQLESMDWPVIKMDMGDQIQRTVPQAQIKLESTYQAISSVMKYDVIGLGPGELKSDWFSLYSTLINAGSDREAGSPFVSANVSFLGEVDQTVRSFTVVEKGGRRVGVTSVVDTSFFNGMGDMNADDREMKIESPEAALAKVVPRLMEEKCDVCVLLAYVSEERSRQLIQKFPQFHFVVNEGVEGEPLGKLEYVRVGQRSVAIMQMGYKSMYAGAIAIYADRENPVRFQKIPLDHRFEDTAAMKAVFKAYQEKLERATLAGLVGKPANHPTGYQFVGSQTCADCHQEEFDIWKEGTDAWKAAHPGVPGPHSKATDDLVVPGERTWVKRHHDPECLSCHVTGWNPQQYFAYKTGYWDFEADLKLHGSGCENCHGPGSQHVAIENGEIEVDANEAEKVLQQLRITKEAANQNLCATCHDLNNSPDFDFEKYWPMIAH